MQKNADRVDLEKCWKINLLSLSEASIQPRTGPPKSTNLLNTEPSSRRRNSHGYICTPVVASTLESAKYAAPHAMTQNDAPKTRSRIVFLTNSSRTNNKPWAGAFIFSCVDFIGFLSQQWAKFRLWNARTDKSCRVTNKILYYSNTFRLLVLWFFQCSSD